MSLEKVSILNQRMEREGKEQSEGDADVLFFIHSIGNARSKKLNPLFVVSFDEEFQILMHVGKRDQETGQQDGKLAHALLFPGSHHCKKGVKAKRILSFNIIIMALR